MNKEDKFSIGRPKLADKKLKKKSYIMLCISSLLIIILLSGTLVSLNIMPMFGKMKGEVSCSSIPDYLSYNEETNPNGFKDINFYSAVISSYGYGVNGNWNRNSDSTLCNTITEEQLATITTLSEYGKNITDANGIQYLTGLTRLELSNNQLTNIDLSQNTALTELYLRYSQLTSIDVSQNTALTNLYLSGNQLTSIDLSVNTALTQLNLSDNQLSSIDLSANTALAYLDLGNNQLTSINLSKNTTLTSLQLGYNRLNTIDLSNFTTWTGELDLSNNQLSGELDLSHIYFNLGSNSIDLSYNNLTKLKFGPNGCIDHVHLNNNNLTYLEFNTLETGYIDLSNNNLSNIVGLERVIYTDFYGYNNNFLSINLSSIKRSDDNLISIGNNPMTETKYLVNGSKIDYNPVTLNEDFPITTEISNEEVILLSNSKLKTLKEGTSTIKMSNENTKGQNELFVSIYTYISKLISECRNACDEEEIINKLSTKYNVTIEDIQNMDEYSPYFFSQEIKVYDIESDKYNIDKDKKEIDLKNKEFNINNITLTLDGLIGVADGDKYIIKDGDVVVDTYTLVNVGGKTDNLSSDNKVDTKVITTTKKKKKTTKKNNSKKVIITTTEVKNEEKENISNDIIINKLVGKKTTTRAKETKENNISIIPIIIGGIVLIAGLGYGIYSRKIK